MSEYKLVPFEPTPEMVEAAEEAHMPFGDMDLALRMAILAAPAVQGEPVGYGVRGAISKIWDGRDFIPKDEADGYDDDALFPLYAAPQPAEQQPLKSSLALDAAKHLTNWLEMDWCECEGGHTCGYNEVKRTRDALLVAAEQQPDVTQLAEVLTELCDEIDKHEIHAATSKTSISWFKRKARAVLAAHRKQGGEV